MIPARIMRQCETGLSMHCTSNSVYNAGQWLTTEPQLRYVRRHSCMLLQLVSDPSVATLPLLNPHGVVHARCR